MGGILVAALAGLSVFGGTDGSDADPVTVPTVEARPPPPPAGGPLVLDASATTPPDAILAAGVLTAVDAGSPGSEPVWRTWDPGANHPRTIPLPMFAERWTLDDSGRALAFTVPSGPDRRSLWVRYVDGSGVRVADDVLSFAWKVGSTDRIAWSMPASEGIRLMTAHIDASGLVRPVVVADVDPGVVVGWTSLGIWVEGPGEVGDERTFRAYAVSGAPTAIARGEFIVFHPDGDRYLVASVQGDTWNLVAHDRGRERSPLQWDLGDLEPTAGAWSHHDPGRLALAGFDRVTQRWWIGVGDARERSLVHRFDLPYRVLDVGWSPGDGLLVARVTDDRGQSAVIAHDVSALIDHRVGFRDVVAAAIVPVPGAVVTVPAVTGLPVGEAADRIDRAGLTSVVAGVDDGVGLAVVQSPEPGTEVAAGTPVTVWAAVPTANPELTDLTGDALGNESCAPPSPVGPVVAVGESGGSLTEMRGVGDFELWAQLLTPLPLRTDREVKMVLRFDVSGAPVIQVRNPILLARHPARRVVYSRWGPFLHPEGASGYERPGEEWSAAFRFREPGCWRVRVVVGFEVSEFFVRVW